MIKSPLHVSSPHDSAADHVTGAAIYVDDMPSPKGMLWGMVVPSPVAKGKIKRLDVDAARALPGVSGVFTAADVPGMNQMVLFS